MNTVVLKTIATLESTFGNMSDSEIIMVIATMTILYAFATIIHNYWESNRNTSQKSSYSNKTPSSAQNIYCGNHNSVHPNKPTEIELTEFNSDQHRKP